MNGSIPYYTISEVTNEYMLASFNDRRKYYINYLSHAKWVWKELFWNTIWAIKHKYIEVDTSTTPYSIVIPKDCVRLINVSVEDSCDNIRSLTYNDSMNVFTKPVIEHVCKSCGESDDLGQCFTNISVVQKDVIIDSVVYKEKLWKKLCANGEVVEIRQVPAKSYTDNQSGDYTIEWETIERFICKLDQKPCGCIKNTAGNKELIKSACGVLLVGCQRNLCDPQFSKANAKFGNIKVEGNRVYIPGTNAKQMLVSYQTNGECGEDEIMIPEFAVNAVIYGIDSRSKALAPNVSSLDKRESRIGYAREVQKMEEFLNPIYIVEFMNAQMAIPLWGSNSDQSDMRTGGNEDCDTGVVQTKNPVIDNVPAVSSVSPVASPSVVYCSKIMLPDDKPLIVGVDIDADLTEVVLPLLYNKRYRIFRNNTLMLAWTYKLDGAGVKIGFNIIAPEFPTQTDDVFTIQFYGDISTTSTPVIYCSEIMLPDDKPLVVGVDIDADLTEIVLGLLYNKRYRIFRNNTLMLAWTYKLNGTGVKIGFDINLPEFPTQTDDVFIIQFY